MAIVLNEPRTLADLLDHLAVPPERVLLYESRLGVVLAVYIENYLALHPLGFVLDASGMCRVERHQVRLPDVSFSSWDHFPGKVMPADEQILDMAPDWTVEILNPSNTVREMERKRLEYFAAGIRDLRRKKARRDRHAKPGEVVGEGIRIRT